jgi:AcrR family transcriptional regulator
MAHTFAKAQQLAPGNDMSKYSHMTTRISAKLSPRKTPRQARAQATCDAIIEAAARIIAAGGLAAFNTNAVAERAGVSIGSLYQYFPNKDALMVALIERQQDEQLARVEAATRVAPARDLTATVRLIVRAAMAHHHDDSLLASAIDHEEARLPVAAMLDDYLRRGGGAVAGLLMRHAHEIALDDIDRAVRTLPALVRSAVDAWANLSPPRLDIAEDEAVRAVLGYLIVGRAPG